MDTNRKFWNEQQQILQRALKQPDEHHAAIELFLRQHAAVHAAAMSHSEAWSFEDEVLQHISEESLRRIPKNGEHSITWILWHIARIEDVTMNLLVAGCPQILFSDGWLEQMNATICHTGNAMSAEAVAKLSAALNIEALKAYRIAVGRRTREIVQQLPPQELRRKPEAFRLDQIKAEAAVVEAASEIIDYWGGRSKAGLLLMPATRHNFMHLNEALRIKQKLRAA
jgi:hypothetical protein